MALSLLARHRPPQSWLLHVLPQRQVSLSLLGLQQEKPPSKALPMYQRQAHLHKPSPTHTDLLFFSLSCFHLDIWQFTTYWTLIFIVSIYTMAGFWAFIVFSRRRYKWAILLPVFFFVTGAFIAFLSGSLVGKGELKPPLAVATCTHHGPWITDISVRNGTGRDTEKEGEAGRDCRLFKEEYEEAVGTIWI